MKSNSRAKNDWVLPRFHDFNSSKDMDGRLKVESIYLQTKWYWCKAFSSPKN